MNKIKQILTTFLVVLSLTFQSCNDDDHYALGDIAMDWATVVSSSPGTYYLKSDSWGTLWPAATSIPGYRPNDGQRVIALFNPLSDDFQGFDHAVKVERIDEILTKKVELLTSENDADFGNDPLFIMEDGIWLAGGFLNIGFVQNMPAQKKHRISLVSPTMQADEEGYVAMELRYNNYDDVTGIGLNGYVSYDIRPFFSMPEVKGIQLKCNLEETGEYKVTIPFE